MSICSISDTLNYFNVSGGGRIKLNTAWCSTTFNSKKVEQEKNKHSICLNFKHNKNMWEFDNKYLNGKNIAIV